MPAVINENVLSLSGAARSVPAVDRGKRPNPSTVFRWIREGVRVASGERVHLESARIGSRLVTSAEALERFFARLAEADSEGARDPHPSQPDTAPASARRRTAEAEARCEQLGV